MNDNTSAFLSRRSLNSLSSDTEPSADWEHVDLSLDGAHSWIESQESLERNVVDAISATETRPRSFKVKNGILIILRGVNTNPGHDPEDMVSVRVWIEPNRVITTTRRPVISIKDIDTDLDTNIGPRTPSEFLIELVNKLADRIGDFVEKLDEELEEMEDALEEIRASEMRSRLVALRKQIAMVRRYLSPQRDALDRLNYLESPILSERDRTRLREESDRISRHLEDLDLARERALVLHEAHLAQIAQQQNNRMYALSIITAVFLPLGFITGLLGINVGGLPGVEDPRAFWVVCGLLTLLALIITLSFRKLRWL